MKHLVKRTYSRQNLENTLNKLGLPGPTIVVDSNERGIIASGFDKDFRLTPLGRKIEKGQLDFVKFDRDFVRQAGLSTISAYDVYYNLDVYNSLLVASDIYDLNTSSTMSDIHIAYNNFIMPRYGYAELTFTNTDRWTRIKYDFLNTVKRELGLSGLRIPAKNPKFAVGKKFGRFTILDIDEWIPTGITNANEATTTVFYAIVPSNTTATQEEIELAVKMLGLKYYYYENSLTPGVEYTKPSQLPLIKVNDPFDVLRYSSTGQVNYLDSDWNANYTTNIEGNSMFATMLKFMFDYYDANSYGNFGYATDSYANPMNSWVNCYNNNKTWIYTKDIVASLKNVSDFRQLVNMLSEPFCIEFIWSRYCDVKNNTVRTNMFDCRMSTTKLSTYNTFIGGSTADEIKENLLAYNSTYSRFRNGVYAGATELAREMLLNYKDNGPFTINFETRDSYYFNIKYLDTNLFKFGLDILEDDEYDNGKKLVFNIDKDSLVTNSSEIFVCGDNGKCWNTTMENYEKPTSDVYDKSGRFTVYCKQGSMKYLIDMVVYIEANTREETYDIFLKYTVKNMATPKTHVI